MARFNNLGILSQPKLLQEKILLKILRCYVVTVMCSYDVMNWKQLKYVCLLQLLLEKCSRNLINFLCKIQKQHHKKPKRLDLKESIHNPGCQWDLSIANMFLQWIPVYSIHCSQERTKSWSYPRRKTSLQWTAIKDASIAYTIL